MTEETKPSITFALHGNSSVLSVDFDEPIVLDDKFDHGIGLTNLETYYSIPNIIHGKNNRIKIGNKEITLDTGCYELESIENVINNQLEEDQQFIQIKPNLNTLRCEMKATGDVDLSMKDSLAPILGFEHKIYQKGKQHFSTKPINILPISACFVECNISGGSFNNKKPGHSLFTFFPNVGVGSKISLMPQTVLYLPVVVKAIRNITVRIVDQDGSLVNFQQETITVVLHLKPM